MTRPVELKQAGLYLTFVRVSLMLFRVDTIKIAIQIQMKRMFVLFIQKGEGSIPRGLMAIIMRRLWAFSMSFSKRKRRLVLLF